MNLYEAALMGAPSVPRQPYCPVCGKTGGQTGHHVVARGQGGEEGPVIYLCGSGTTGCHGLAEDERLHFAHNYWDEPGWFYFLSDVPTKVDDPWKVAPWMPLSIYDECRDDPSPEDMDADDGEFLDECQAAIVALSSNSNATSYRISHTLKAALEAFEKRYPPKEARRRLTEWAAELEDEQGNKRPIAPSTLSKMLAGADLPDIVSIHDLSVAERYRLKRALDTRRASFEDTIDDLYHLSREDFDQNYFDKVPAMERDRHTCPDCGAVHAKKRPA